MSGQEPGMGPDLGPNVPPSAGRIGTAVGGETVLMTIKNCSNFVQSEEVVISRWLGISDPVCPGPHLELERPGCLINSLNYFPGPHTQLGNTNWAFWGIGNTQLRLEIDMFE